MRFVIGVQEETKTSNWREALNRLFKDLLELIVNLRIEIDLIGSKNISKISLLLFDTRNPHKLSSSFHVSSTQHSNPS